MTLFSLYSSLKNDYINGNYRRISYSCTQEFEIPINVKNIRNSGSESNFSNLQIPPLPSSSEDTDFDDTSETYKDLNLQSGQAKKCQTIDCDGSGSSRLRPDGKSFYKSHRSVDNCPKIRNSLEYSVDEKDISELKQKLIEANER